MELRPLNYYESHRRQFKTQHLLQMTVTMDPSRKAAIQGYHTLDTRPEFTLIPLDEPQA